MSDLSVQRTNDDASVSKRHAVRLGYYEDPFLAALTRGCSGVGGGEASKPPEISRGYWARVQALRALLLSLLRGLQQHQQCQVVNLGAGSDTAYMCLRSAWPDAAWLPVKWVDVDLPDNTGRKVLQVTSSQQLLAAIGGEDVDIVHNRHELHADPYHIVPADLREPAALADALRACGLDRAAPTVFLAECVLVYLPAEASAATLARLAGEYRKSAFLHYEQVNLSDRFGEVMLANFRTRGCDLAGAAACASEAAQRRRFLDAGWPAVSLWTMRQVYAALPQAARSRVERIEMLDEREGFDQLLEHYCIACASCPPFPASLDLEACLASVR